MFKNVPHFFTENNKWVLLISVFQYVYFIHLTAPVYSQAWNICGKKGIKFFFHQAFSPTSCHPLWECCMRTSILPPGLVIQLICHKRTGQLHLPLNASLECKTMVGICLFQQVVEEQFHRARKWFVAGNCREVNQCEFVGYFARLVLFPPFSGLNPGMDA